MMKSRVLTAVSFADLDETYYPIVFSSILAGFLPKKTAPFLWAQLCVPSPLLFKDHNPFFWCFFICEETPAFFLKKRFL
jgi:hypothetical protein